MAAFEVYAFNAAGRVRGIERHKLEPVFAVHIVDAFDGHFVIAVADLSLIHISISLLKLSGFSISLGNS